MRGTPPEILELRAACDEIAAELSAAAPLLDRYVIQSSEGSSAGFAGHLSSPSPKGSGTAAAFCAFFLFRSDAASFSHASLGLAKALASQVETRCIVALSQARTGASDPEPNNYKLPIYIAGIAALTNSKLIDHDKAWSAIDPGIKELCARLQGESAGALMRVGAFAQGEPSAYHTYWAAQALTEVLSSPVLTERLQREGRAQAVADCLTATYRWAEGALASLIADHHAGIKSRFDSIELVCAASLASMGIQRTTTTSAGTELRLPGPSDEALRLTAHGLEVVFDKYFSDGSLARSKPVYADAQKNSIFCSTPEALFYLLAPSESAAPSSESVESWNRKATTIRPHLSSLFKAFHLLRRGRILDGYLPDLDGAFGIEPRANAFSTIAGFCFLVRAAKILDDELDGMARALLRVPVFIRDEEILSRPYPHKLGEILTDYVVSPLSKGDRESAYYSIILHGPPGTAKTTLAKQLAQDLKWPLLEITQRDFLADGTAFIDAAADRIFCLVGLLKNVVVLFDELEELIGSRDPGPGQNPERESRLLTTSMLPRIHDLRDRQRIVFIFATNRIHSFDPAATRPGRFDIIQLVPPPITADLERYLASLCSKSVPDLEGELPTRKEKRLSRKLKSAVGKVKLVSGMTYKDVALFFNELRRQVVLKEKTFGDEELTTLAGDFQSISDTVAEHFRALSTKHDRP